MYKINGAEAESLNCDLVSKTNKQRVAPVDNLERMDTHLFLVLNFFSTMACLR